MKFAKRGSYNYKITTESDSNFPLLEWELQFLNLQDRNLRATNKTIES